LGQTLPIIDGATGGIRQAPLFVAALVALSYFYPEAGKYRLVIPLPLQNWQ